MADIKQREPASEESLEKIVALLGALLTSDIESLVEKVRVLEPMGLSTAEIARASGASESGVRTTQSRLKKN